MALTSAEKQKAYRERERVKLEALRQAANGGAANVTDDGEVAALRRKLAKAEARIEELGSPGRRHGDGDAAVAAKIVNKFGDTKWHTLSAVVTFVNRKLSIECDEAQVKQWLDAMVKTGAGGAKTEGRKGASFEYRFYRNKRMISSYELADKIAPIIKELKAQGKCNMATMSPASVAILASRLQKLMGELGAETFTESDAASPPDRAVGAITTSKEMDR